MKFKWSIHNNYKIKKSDENIQFAGKTIRRRTANCLGIVCISVMFALLLWIKGKEKQQIVDGKIERPGYEEASTQMALDIEIDSKESENTEQIVIQPVQYEEEESEELFDQIYDDLKVSILGENESLEQIRSNLKLHESQKAVTLEWYSSDYNLIDFNGEVNNSGLSDKEKRDVILTVVMKYKSYTAQYDINVTVLPKILSVQEETNKKLKNAIGDIENQQREDRVIELPNSIDGKKVKYYMHNDSPSPVIALVLGAAAIAAIIFGEKQQKEKLEQVRKAQLERDYCEVISKLVLLAGAGMTIRRAWEKIVADYLKSRENHQSELRYAYEEMTETWNQISTGIPEETAYERFGKRCGINVYVKFGALLEQNIRKGSGELLHLLEQESEQAFELRKNAARKKGEEAGTRLLMPMMLMLLVVLVIVMVPALQSFKM